jgi:hypothetical protein
VKGTDKEKQKKLSLVTGDITAYIENPSKAIHDPELPMNGSKVGKHKLKLLTSITFFQIIN